ncbi:uncharacterized protein LOC110617110 [Manihot esculenta]|uniref:SAM domain-containing protein n=1 Tax=Manihot esculenta TaxID=3983 RepID=A0A251L4R5_MANES|nr:uncharacterized protein LOC110617110 [Manihot esculenta]XP_021615411.1 uncharacterized protein LOC110617110 [Manihot esculenta]OAY48019.1 hypothetical protein MANES_06G125000v8 [Manihot esculenta]
MADLPPPESHLNGGNTAGERGGPSIAVASSETVGSKRQRRPSVRLGEIGGDQLYDSHSRRTTSNKQWKHHHLLSLDHKKDPNTSSKGSKTRALTNLTISGEFTETLDEDKEVNLDAVAIGSWRVKDSKKRASNATTKRVRSSWVSKIDDAGGGSANNNVEGDEKYSGGEDVDDTYRGFDMENSESPLKEQSPVHSLENLGDGNERNEREIYYNRWPLRARDNHNYNHHHDGVELSGPSDTDARDYRNNGRCGGGGEDGVRIWLNSIGLGRYAPVFEIHEVDDEILPMLTLEDLKDMGINAVGTRRKMFCAIQKLGKGFS